MGRKNRRSKNRSKHGREYKQHSGSRTPTRPSEKKKLYSSRSKNYIENFNLIVVQELGGYYWSGAQQEEPHNDHENIEAGR